MPCLPTSQTWNRTCFKEVYLGRGTGEGTPIGRGPEHKQLRHMANASNLLLDLTAELLSRGTTVRFRPSGRSMYPSIREGELITVEPVVPSDVKLGDIVLYGTERGLIAHRVVEVSNRAAGFSLRASSSRDVLVFQLRGDASLSCDQPVVAHQILGRVVGVKRNGRSVALATRGAKMWHRARRLASGLKGWIDPAGTGSHPDLDFLGETLTVVEGQLH